MIVRHNLPTTSYTRIDRNVFALPDVSDGAKVLYGFLCGLRSGSNFSDTYVMGALGVSRTALTRRKAELKKARLILVHQVSPRVFVLYIGHTRMPADAVKLNWDKEDMCEEL
jgi:hypothetical protein